jgi:hypothetical protein
VRSVHAKFSSNGSSGEVRLAGEEISGATRGGLTCGPSQSRRASPIPRVISPRPGSSKPFHNTSVGNCQGVMASIDYLRLLSAELDNPKLPRRRLCFIFYSWPPSPRNSTTISLLNISYCHRLRHGILGYLTRRCSVVPSVLRSSLTAQLRSNSEAHETSINNNSARRFSAIIVDIPYCSPMDNRISY